MKNIFTGKLNRKIESMCILLAILICAGCCIGGYVQYRNSIYKNYNGFAYELCEMARSYVNGDEVEAFAATGELGANYENMTDNIFRLYEKSSLYDQQSGIYICIPSRDSMTVKNFFDVRVVEAGEETLEYFLPGVEDPIAADNSEHLFTIYEKGEKVDDYFIHETKFGYNSSAILPVFNSKGEPVAIMVCDYPIPNIAKSLNTYLLTTILITILIVALFMAAFITIIRRTVVNPLKTIASEADSFTKSEIEISKVLPTIKNTDEIGGLARSIFKMENDINTYVNNLTAITAEKERIGAELDIATRIQSSMLPCIFPAFPERDDLDIYASMNPAKEVGGDFYDFFMIDEKHIAIVMADVSGKGIPAALFMVIGKTLIKDHTQLNLDLSQVFSEVNDLLCEANSEGLFITAFEGVLDLETGIFNFVNAGHEWPFICKKGELYKPYQTKAGFVLAGMNGMKYKAGSIQFEVGDKIFQYTDGVTEATNGQSELFGMERLEKSLAKCANMTPEETLKTVKSDVDEFVGDEPQFDDITMLCLEYKKKFEN